MSWINEPFFLYSLESITLLNKLIYLTILSYLDRVDPPSITTQSITTQQWRLPVDHYLNNNMRSHWNNRFSRNLQLFGANIKLHISGFRKTDNRMQMLVNFLICLKCVFAEQNDHTGSNGCKCFYTV